MTIGVAWAEGSWVDESWATGAWNAVTPQIAWLEAVMVDVIINNDTTSEKSNYMHSDRTNFRVDELKTEWTGAMVAPDEWESKHPQDFVKSRGGEREYGPQSPEDDNNFISTAVTIDDL